MEKFKLISKDKISQLPKTPGVYAFKNQGKILYIGKAANLRERVKNHFQQPSYKDYLFLDKVEKIGYIKTDSEIEALILEANLIKKIKPKFNVLWKDDKNYFFVAITKEDFPRVFITHQLKPETCSLKAEFIGPFVDGKALKKTLKFLRKIFPFRSCKKIPKRPCLWYQLERCPGPCQINLKSQIPNLKSFRSKIKRVCQRNAENLIKILKEGKIPIFKKLKKEMKKAAKEEKFEEAARLRDQIFALEKVFEHSKVFEEIKPKALNWSEIEEKLKKIFKYEGRISRIESFDVSNIRGKMATGSMVTFVKGVPEKKFYRKFKIKFERIPNDIGMLKEILERRFKHLEWGLPDLILVDGGKGQLKCAIETKNQRLDIKNIKIAALAKKKNELFVEGKKEPISLKSLPREISNLFLKLNKEAHRFAISYHRKLREKGL
jgi:excinuclease ABC subunit C